MRRASRLPCSRVTSVVLACVLMGLGLGQAMAGDEDGTAEDAVPYPSGIDCFWIPRPSGYNVIDSKHLVIKGTGSSYYLATLFNHCFDLRTTFGIKLDRRGSNLCTGDKIITGEDRCHIRFLEEVESYAEGRQMVADRNAAAKEEREEGSGNSQ